MKNVFFEIKTAKDLVIHIRAHGFCTDLDCINHAADVLGRSSESEIVEAANVDRTAFFHMARFVWNLPDIIRFYLDHLWSERDEYQRLQDAEHELTEELNRVKAELQQARVALNTSNRELENALDSAALEREQLEQERAIHAQEIQALKAKLYDMQNGEGPQAELVRENEKLKAQVKALRTSSGTNMPQEDYEALRKAASSGDLLNDHDAIRLICQEFAFDPEQITIHHNAGLNVTPEGSRYLQLKDVARPPINVSTDWNYIRFDAGNWYYEMINGQLHPYYC